MLTGIIVGGLIVAIISITSEVRIEIRRKEIKRLREKMEKSSQQLEDMRKSLKDLAKSSTDLIYDYFILAEILKEEIGLDEANKRYSDKKNTDQPKDLNEFLAKIER